MNITSLEQDALGYTYRERLDRAGATDIRLEYFLESDPERAYMWIAYTKRLNELLSGGFADYATYVVDSVTYMEMTCRMYGKILNPPPKFDQRHWGGYRTDQMEQVLCMSLAAMPINIIVLCHCGEERDELNGSFVRTLYAPARLGEKRGLGAGYAEIYHMMIGRDEHGQLQYSAQTQTDQMWAAATQIDAPNPSWPTYDSLWVNWEAKNKGRARPTLHWVLYGDFGSGKSTMAATFPKPMLVHMFDPFGKDMPYLK